MELNNDDRRRLRMSPRIEVVYPAGSIVPRAWLPEGRRVCPVTAGGVPKPCIVRLNGRWFLRSAPYTSDEDPAVIWEYWELATVAAQWCFKMNESQAWEQWGREGKS